MKELEQYILQSGLEEEGEFMPLFTLEEEDPSKSGESYPDVLPVLALKNTVLFPGVVIPITIGRDRSLKAINVAYDDQKVIAVLSQRDTQTENPGRDDLYDIGTVARIIKLLRMPDGSATAIIQGRQRFELKHLVRDTPYLEGEITVLHDTQPESEMEFEATASSVRDMAKQIIQLSPNIPSEAAVVLKNITQNHFLLNFIASNLNIKQTAKQAILETDELQKRAEMLLEFMDSELQLLELKDQIESKVRNDIEKQQRDYYLSQQLKTIQEELGQNTQEEEIQELIAKAEQKDWPVHVKKTFDKEISKLRRTNPQAADFAVLMNYMELLIDLPWETYTRDNFNLKKVKMVLDKDHFGLEDVKKRILEHLAVLKLKGDMKAPILCLVGPPGVGKTSLGKSIAKAINRKYIRMSLGGLHDEAEIRGHRKTYIGAMPGRIIQALRKAESSNPVLVLDEIDKVGKDFRGDPSSALLEVLDPEQNNTFQDNYLELEYDLSRVMFIATANSLSTIQPALLDRMEIIEISGYSVEEKLEIAKQHLIPEQLKEHGLQPKNLKLKTEILRQIIEDYTRESGVRSLNRQIAGIMRGVAKRVAMGESYNTTITPEEVKEILGSQKYSTTLYNEVQAPGVAIGLAWTSVGGDILFIESSLSQGKGKLTLTGNLGDVMKESATTALSYLRAHATDLGFESREFDERDIHIHVPEGAIPKDGPSAGITMLSSLTSAFTQKPLKPHLAMTGEITLRGRVLPVGGIKEKVLAAKRAGITDIILCKENEKDVLEIPVDYISGVRFHYVTQMQQVINMALSK